MNKQQSVCKVVQFLFLALMLAEGLSAHAAERSFARARSLPERPRQTLASVRNGKLIVNEPALRNLAKRVPPAEMTQIRENFTKFAATEAAGAANAGSASRSPFSDSQLAILAKIQARNPGLAPNLDVVPDAALSARDVPAVVTFRGKHK